jgi:Zn-dependent protease with chaperone function
LAAVPGAAPPPAPATDFFAVQDAARARARRYFVLFGLSVVVVVLVVGAFGDFLLVWHRLADTEARTGRVLLPHEALAQTPVPVLMFPVVAAWLLILGSSWQRIRELQHGSAMVATSIGARAVPTDTKDPLERQLVNVVDEMSLASGGLPPALYVLDDEKAINALAGSSAKEPFIVVTRGALERLQRDELQGMVAYGIGQVRNEDATINLRLVGWLAGITILVDIGDSIKRLPLQAFRGRDSDESDDVGKLRLAAFFFAIPFALAGATLAMIGYVGLLLARILRSRVSYHRVFLADATAVQYTRDPVAVRDLLKRIEAEPGAGKLAGRYNEEFGPLLFVPGVQRLCLRTHPTIGKRIDRMERRSAA